jgi:exoribonuclease R
MEAPQEYLESIFGVKQSHNRDPQISGILQTKDYEHFMILSDAGDTILEFEGAKKANQCLPGDHVQWKEEQCILELRDEHPPLVGTIELTHPAKYGLTNRGIPIYLFTPYNQSYPHFIVGCSEKDKSVNRIGLIKFDKWTGTFPRGNLDRILGCSGDYEAEKEALIWQASPYVYPKYKYEVKPRKEEKETKERERLSGITFHVDPEGCKDVDDVFTIEKVSSLLWKVTITISDVMRYVGDGDAIDIMASLIGQTLYDDKGVILRRMLPEAYESVCSLLPGKESYGVSMEFLWDREHISEIRWFESVFETNETYTYELFYESVHAPILKDIASYLSKEETCDSHEWVAEMMIFYNKEAGKILKERGTGLLRKHSAPHQEKIASYPKDLVKQLAYQAAEYCLAEEENTHHYGLDTDTYAHASSPIRRYPDMVNQRIIKRWIHGNPEKYYVPQAIYDINLRAKAVKSFGISLQFLHAIFSGENQWEGILVEKEPESPGWVKIGIYLPAWKRIIRVRYRSLSENLVLSRDEKKEIDVTLYRPIRIECTYNSNLRNWKERVIICIL